MWAALAPLLINVILKLIDWFIDDVKRRNKAKLAFLEFVKTSRKNGLESVRLKRMYQRLIEKVVE